MRPELADGTVAQILPCRQLALPLVHGGSNGMQLPELVDEMATQSSLSREVAPWSAHLSTTTSCGFDWSRPPWKRSAKSLALMAALRHGTWWDRSEKRVVRAGVDFALDTEEGGGDEYLFVPDSDEEDGAGRLNYSDDGDFVPETELQDSKPHVDDSIPMEGKKKTNNNQFTEHMQVTSEDQDLEDFKIECHKVWLSVWTHATLERVMECKRD